MLKSVKAFLALFVAACLVLYPPDITLPSGAVVCASGYTVSVNGQPISFEQAPFETNGVLMVPSTQFVQSLDAQEFQNSVANTVYATKNGRILEMTVNSGEAQLITRTPQYTGNPAYLTFFEQNSAVILEQPPVISNENMFVPAKSVAENLGAQVIWDGGTGVLTVTYSIPSETVSFNYPNRESLGALTSFFQGTQLQGHLLEDETGFATIPSYWMNSSFPYQKNSYDREIPFVDRFSVVRFSGGYHPDWGVGPEEDLAYVENGQVKYRWELLSKLDSYVNRGYDNIIISVDNVPWDLASHYSLGAYGQIAPPRDYNEWYDFIREMCNQLVARYGYSKVNQWTFKVGTEVHNAQPGSVHTWDGTHTEFVNWYYSTEAAVKSVLPGAKVGPGEVGGGFDVLPENDPRVDLTKLAKSCVTEVNPYSLQTGSKLDFFASSSHANPIYDSNHLMQGQINPIHKALTNKRRYETFSGIDPAYSSIDFYMFQFGILTSEYGISTNEPGGRGAAWTFQTLFKTKDFVPSLKGVWHWGGFDEIDDAGGKYLMNGIGWLYSVMDYCEGGEAYLLDAPDSMDGTMYRMLLVKKNGAYYIIATSFNVDRTVTAKKTANVSIPKEFMQLAGQPSLGWTTLTDRNSPYTEVKKDLEAAGLLKQDYKGKDLLAQAAKMGTGQWRTYLVNHFSKYEQLQSESLTLKPFTGSMTDTGTDYNFSFPIEPSSVTVVAVNHPIAVPTPTPTATPVPTATPTPTPTATPVPTPSPVPTPTGQLFSDNFEDGDANGWTIQNGTWSVVTDGSQMYRQTNSATGNSNTGSLTWSNYTLEAKVKPLTFNSGGIASLLFRYNDTNNYYMVNLSQNNRLELRKRVGGTSVTIALKSYTVSPGTAYTVKVSANGSTLEVYVNELLELTATDTSLASGKVALYTWNATAEYDDVTAFGIN